LRELFPPFASWLLDFAQRLAQRLDFAFVSEFLAFGQFDEFEHFLHLVECLFQRLNNLCHFFNRLADGGSRSFDFSFGQCRRVSRRVSLGNLFRSTRAAATATTTATPPSTARTSRLRGKICFGLWLLRHFWCEHDALPDKSKDEL
jgi:hypothetical protein